MKNKSDKTINELRNDLTKAILEMASRKTKNTNLVKNIRRQIARALTKHD